MNYEHESVRKISSRDFADAVEEINKMFPTEADCVDEIYRLCARYLRCKRCTENRFSHNHGERLAFCDTCGTKHSFTAGTALFDNMRRARPVLTALICSANGIVVNAFRLHRSCNTAYECAGIILEKIAGNATKIFEENSTPVLTSAFDDLISRRSSETAANQHPSTEREAELAQMGVGEDVVQSSMRELYGLDSSPVGNENLPFYEDEQVIYDALADGPQNFDELVEVTEMPVSRTNASLTMLLILGLVTALPGERYKRSTKKAGGMQYSPMTKDRIAHSVEFMKSVHAGVSRRHLQRYIATYWLSTGASSDDRAKVVDRCFMPLGRTKTSRRDSISPLVLSFPANFHEENNV